MTKDSLEIEGGLPLNGSIRAAGNKNAALPMIAAALLTHDPVTLDNVPDIGDVHTMLGMAASLGVTVDWQPETRQLRLNAANLASHTVDAELCRRIRAGILLVAPLLHRRQQARMGAPGGDVIGMRRLDVHFDGLRQLGVEISHTNGLVFQVQNRLRGADIFLTEASVTATEQLLLAAVLADGQTVIRHAAMEPHVSDLAHLLVAMGAQIDGIGSGVLVVTGVAQLHGATHQIVSDHTEAGSFLALAAATGGSVTVTNIDPNHYRMTARIFARLGIKLEIDASSIRVDAAQQSRQIEPNLLGGMPVIDDGPWPQFPSDLMSVMLVLATQVHGTVLLFEKMYESRMYFADRLIAMGANAVICDPHRVVVVGPTQLHAIDLTSPDIRAGIALVGAALCAKGTSVIRNLHLVDRGYETVDAKLRQLGARVWRH